MWERGRQNTGYEKLTIISSSFFKFDIHILRMKPGAYVPPHVDPIDPIDKLQGYREHHRLNIILQEAEGGEFKTSSTPPSFKRLIKFRPDIDTHWVTPVQSGTRYVLSIGWLSK